LQSGEQEGEWHDAEQFETHPEICRLCTPDDLVQNRKHEKEQRPTPGQLTPAFVAKVKDGIENHAEQRLTESEPAQQRAAEQNIDDRRLELDEQIVVQDQRQSSEYQNYDSSNQRHDRQAPRPCV